MEELRKLVITNGYEFNETLNTITISKVKDELENTLNIITYDKKDKEISIDKEKIEDRYDFLGFTLNSFELEVLTTIYSLSKNGKILGE